MSQRDQSQDDADSQRKRQAAPDLHSTAHALLPPSHVTSQLVPPFSQLMASAVAVSRTSNTQVAPRLHFRARNLPRAAAPTVQLVPTSRHSTSQSSVHVREQPQPFSHRHVEPAAQVATHDGQDAGQSQVPPLHCWVAAHALVHEPQVSSRKRLCSQPSFATRLQSSKSVAQAETSQTPVAQDSEALSRAQGMPQAPQSERLRIDRSQPSESIELQSSHPTSQRAVAQEPVAQVAVALSRSQGVPQPPQSSIVFSRCSQPLVATPSQSSNMASQTKPQSPERHERRALSWLGQVRSQRPQWSGLVLVSTQLPPHCSRPPVHRLTQPGTPAPLVSQ